MSVVRWMDKKTVVHIHNGILLSHWKGCIWVSSDEVDETGAYYTEWSKSERKTPVQYTSAYIWNLERWWQWPYMWDSKRDTSVKNSLLDSVGEGEGGMIWDNSIEIYITICETDHQSRFNAWDRCSGLVHWDDPEGWDGEGDGMESSGWGIHVHLWLIHVNVWQNHYNIVK